MHADIVRKGVRFTSSLNLDNSDDIIVATAVNKTFNLAGLHITNLIIRNPELRQRLNRYTGGIQISPLAEAATIAAYDECEEWVDEMNDVVDGNLLHMKEFIGKYLPKVRYNLPEATYLAWLDLRAYDVDESELIKLCADEAHLILEGGSMFGDEGRGFIRINVACPKALLEEALDRLNKLLKTLD